MAESFLKGTIRPETGHSPRRGGGRGNGYAHALRSRDHSRNQVQGYTQDSESCGLELEVVGCIVDRCSVSVNYCKNQTMRTNIAPEYRVYLDTHKATWKRYGT